MAKRKGECANENFEKRMWMIDEAKNYAKIQPRTKFKS